MHILKFIEALAANITSDNLQDAVKLVETVHALFESARQQSTPLATPPADSNQEQASS